MNNDVLFWNKHGDLADLVDIRPYDSVNLNGQEACTRCGKPLSDHGVMVLPTRSIEPLSVVCPGQGFAASSQAPAHSEEDKPVVKKLVQEDERFAQMEATMGENEMSPGLSKIRHASKHLDDMLRIHAPNFFKELPEAAGDVSIEEAVTQQEAQEPASEAAQEPAAIQTYIAMVPRELSADQVLMLSGLHPQQPIVYEVEPAETGSGYQITRYQNYPERQKLDSYVIKDMPKYDIDELRLKLTVKAGYQWFLHVYGG